MARLLALRVRGGGPLTGNERQQPQRRRRRQTAGEKRETRLGQQKVTTHLSDEYSIPGIGGGTRTPRTEKTKSTVIRFGRSTLSGRRKYYNNARQNDDGVHEHGKPRTALAIRTRKIITTLENHTCPCVYMQYPFSNKFRSSNTPRTLTDYLP